jgi:hypothetical protein
MGHHLGKLVFHALEYLVFFPKFSWRELSNQDRTTKSESDRI